MMHWAPCREFEISICESPTATEQVSGDRYVVRHCERWLQLAVIDGLGHGEAAHVAASHVVSALDGSEPHLSDVQAWVNRAHQGARGTRGVALSVVSIALDSQDLWWSGVGNVAAALVPANFSIKISHLLARGGIVGYRLPPLRVQQLHFSVHDLIVLASDGLDRSMLDATAWSQRTTANLGELTQTLFTTFRNPNDDALLLIARYLGEGGPT